MKIVTALATSIVAACSGLAAQPAVAQTATLVPFDQFYRQVSAATPLRQAAVPGSPTIDPVAFAPMRDHVVNLYAGVQVKHSFLLDAHPFDCIPILQQPGARHLGLQSIAFPPPAPDAPGTSRTAGAFSQLQPSEATDPLGNSAVCETGTIPMRRVTLEDIGRFRSLGEFLQKGPDGAGQAPLHVAAAVATSHKYAHSYQYVTNLGGSSYHNLWNPTVNTSLNEVFSLSQFWYSNSKGSLQTVEMGLQNYPQKYNTTKSVLFIFWTSDNYSTGSGCYNLDCTGFVQTNKSVYFGKGFNNYSSDGGTQYAPQLTAYLSGGNWWLYLNGTAASNAIGYYPASLFKNKAMASGANEIDYGGESVGATIWPPMGSGQFAKKGFSHAAFVKNVLYYPKTGGATTATLSGLQPSPSCFTDVTTNASDNSGNGTHFYYGGPGGKSC